MIKSPEMKDVSCLLTRTYLLARIRVVILSIAAVLFMGGCFSPSFDEEVTLASLTKPKLQYLHTVSTSQISSPISQVFYLPVPATTLGGFLRVSIDGYPKLYYLKSNSLKGPIEGNNPIPTLPGLEYAYGLVFGNFITSPLLVLYFPSFSNASGGVSDLLLFSYDENTSSLQGPIVNKKALTDVLFPLYFSTYVPGVPVSDLYLLGLQLRSSSTAADIYIDTFVLQKSNKRCYELSFRMDSSGTVQFHKNLILDRTVDRTYLKFTPPSPFSDSTVGRYFYSPDSKKSYAQIYRDGKYRTYYWDAEGVLREISLEGKIAMVLSSNDILCVNEKYGFVYSPEGKSKFKFALGSLSVISELMLNSVPTIFFVEPIDQRDEGGQLFYETYTLATAELWKLKE